MKVFCSSSRPPRMTNKSQCYCFLCNVSSWFVTDLGTGDWESHSTVSTNSKMKEKGSETWPHSDVSCKSFFLYLEVINSIIYKSLQQKLHVILSGTK